MTTKSVGIRELKDHLSAYLRDVRSGSRVIVFDRDEMIAELQQPSKIVSNAFGNPLLLEWANKGLIALPKQEKKQKCPPSPLRVAEGTAKRLINEDRGQ